MVSKTQLLKLWMSEECWYFRHHPLKTVRFKRKKNENTNASKKKRNREKWRRKRKPKLKHWNSAALSALFIFMWFSVSCCCFCIVTHVCRWFWFSHKLRISSIKYRMQRCFLPFGEGDFGGVFIPPLLQHHTAAQHHRHHRIYSVYAPVWSPSQRVLGMNLCVLWKWTTKSKQWQR